MMKNRKKLAGVLATATVLTSAFAPLTVMAEDFDAYNPTGRRSRGRTD